MLNALEVEKRFYTDISRTIYISSGAAAPNSPQKSRTPATTEEKPDLTEESLKLTRDLQKKQSELKGLLKLSGTVKGDDFKFCWKQIQEIDTSIKHLQAQLPLVTNESTQGGEIQSMDFYLILA